MKLTQFDNQIKEELSLVEIATAILEETGEAMPFANLVDEIIVFLGADANGFDDRKVQFYTDLNVTGSFISLGNNVWGLRAWYPVDSIDENVHALEELDDEETTPKKKPAKKKVNVFADTAEDDVIDYNDDDPEDEEFDEVEVESEDDDEDEIESTDADDINAHLSELAGTDDLDDLGDGDQE